MTADVISLDDRRNRLPACGCARHRLEALTGRALAELAGTEGQMLIGREVLAHVVHDLVSTIEAAIASNQRTNP
jgi:hypothetical protein